MTRDVTLPLGHLCVRRVQCTASARTGWTVLDQDGTQRLVRDIDWEAFGEGEVVGLGEWVAEGPLEVRPVFSGRTVFAFAENYGHEGDGRRESPPLLFTKPWWCVVAEDEPVAVGSWVDRGARVWGESELALVIGDRGPIGVTLANDVTMEVGGFETQDHHLPFFKGLPGFCPCSSVLLPLTTCESYRLEGLHNGELLRLGCHQDEIRSWPELLEWLGSWARVCRGDLVLLGAPRRVRDRQYARPGDVYTTRLNGQISLETRFV